jgi:hypothetical protein
MAPAAAAPGRLIPPEITHGGEFTGCGPPERVQACLIT